MTFDYATLMRSGGFAVVGSVGMGAVTVWAERRDGEVPVAASLAFPMFLILLTVGVSIFLQYALSPWIRARFPQPSGAGWIWRTGLQLAVVIGSLWAASILLQLSQNMARRVVGLKTEPLRWINRPENDSEPQA